MEKLQKKSFVILRMILHTIILDWIQKENDNIKINTIKQRTLIFICTKKHQDAY